MDFLEYTSFHFIWIDIVVWLVTGAFSFASLIKGSDHIKEASGHWHWHWWIFRCLKVLLIFISWLYIYQGVFHIVPVFLLDLLMHSSLAALLTWQFIYKRIIKKDWYGSNGQTARNSRLFAGHSNTESQEESYQAKLSKAKRVLSELQQTPQHKTMV